MEANGLVVLEAIEVTIWRFALGEDIRRVAGRGRGIAASPGVYMRSQVVYVAGLRGVEWWCC